MLASKLALSVGVAVLALSSSAAADRKNEIWFHNSNGHSVVLQYAVGNSTNCNDNRIHSGSRAIGARDTLKLEIKAPHPKFACFRVGAGKWTIESLTHGKDYSFTIR